MKLYIVRNGNYTQGYYKNPENADKEMERVNRLIDRLVSEGNKKVDRKHVFVNVIETDD